MKAVLLSLASPWQAANVQGRARGFRRANVWQILYYDWLCFTSSRREPERDVLDFICFAARGGKWVCCSQLRQRTLMIQLAFHRQFGFTTNLDDITWMHLGMCKVLFSCKDPFLKKNAPKKDCLWECTDGLSPTMKTMKPKWGLDNERQEEEKGWPCISCLPPCNPPLPLCFMPVCLTLRPPFPCGTLAVLKN